MRIAELTERHKVVLRHVWRKPVTELQLADDMMSDEEKDEFFRSLTPISLVLAELREAEILAQDRHGRLYVPPEVKQEMRKQRNDEEKR